MIQYKINKVVSEELDLNLTAIKLNETELNSIGYIPRIFDN